MADQCSRIKNFWVIFKQRASSVKISNDFLSWFSCNLELCFVQILNDAAEAKVHKNVPKEATFSQSKSVVQNSENGSEAWLAISEKKVWKAI